MGGGRGRQARGRELLARSAVGLLLGTSALAAILPGGRDEAKISYRKEIAPLLGEHCVACHCEEEASSELVLTTVEAIRKGGKRGGAVAPKDPESSLLLQLVKGLREPKMPPEGESLSDEQVRKIERWIKEGAEDDSRD